MHICPSCHSDQIKFNCKQNLYCCIDCWETFEKPLNKTPGVHLFFSYGHDENKPLVEKIKTYLTDRGHTIWIDESEIKAGDNWRRKIADGVRASDSVLAFLSKHSVRIPGVCRDELRIALCVQHARIQTILIEKESVVLPPASLCDTQWLDMSDWKTIQQFDEETFDKWFKEKMDVLCMSIESDEIAVFNEEIENLKKTLSPILSYSKEHRLASKPMFGREWLMKAIEEWGCDRNTERVFLITGTAGSGKSTFAANSTHYNGRVYAGLFFEWDIAESYSPINFIRTLAFKLAVRLPDYRAALLQLDNKDNLDSFSEETLMDYLITSPLSACIDGNREPILILLDGLDEIGSSGEKLLRILANAIPKFPPWIKFVLTSRPNEELFSFFGSIKHVSLSNDTFGEISKYIYTQLEESIDFTKCAKIARRCEGSFLYAETLCEAIRLGELHIDDTLHIPYGIRGFYYINFERTFSNRDYSQARKILELLVVDGSLPRILLKHVLKMDEYTFVEQMRPLKNLLSTTYSHTSKRGSQQWRESAIISFHHKTIGEWLCDSSQAGKYFVDKQAGKEILATYGLRIIYAKMGMTASRSKDVVYSYIYRKLPHLLVDCCRFKDYENLLLDKEAEREHLWETYTYGDDYYNSNEAYDFSLWCRLSDFPSDYNVDTLHKVFHHSFDLFRKLLIKGIYQSTVMYGNIFKMFQGQLHQEFMYNELCYVLENIINPTYLRSAASDTYQHSGLPYCFNADKLRAALVLNSLVDECKTNGYSFSDNDLHIIENFRLSALYCEGDTDLDTIYLNCSGLFTGRISTLDVTKITALPQNIAAVKMEFNSYVLFNYITTSHKVNSDFVQQLLKHGANFETVEQITKKLMYRLNPQQIKALEQYQIKYE